MIIFKCFAHNFHWVEISKVSTWLTWFADVSAASFDLVFLWYLLEDEMLSVDFSSYSPSSPSWSFLSSFKALIYLEAFFIDFDGFSFRANGVIAPGDFSIFFDFLDCQSRRMLILSKFDLFVIISLIIWYDPTCFVLIGHDSVCNLC